MSDLFNTGHAALLSPQLHKDMSALRSQLQQCKDDEERYNLCIVTRDSLLREHAQMETKFASYDSVMFQECNLYRSRRGRPRTMSPEYVDGWETFLGIATNASTIVSQRVKALKQPCERWGFDVIKHYRWFEHSTKRCLDVRAAAHAEPDQRIAFIKLAQLQNRRIQNGGLALWGFDPLRAEDLRNLKRWCNQTPFIVENDPEKKPLSIERLEVAPSGYQFDAYGLLVRIKPSERPVSQHEACHLSEDELIASLEAELQEEEAREEFQGPQAEEEGERGAEEVQQAQGEGHDEVARDDDRHDEEERQDEEVHDEEVHDEEVHDEEVHDEEVHDDEEQHEEAREHDISAGSGDGTDDSEQRISHIPLSPALSDPEDQSRRRSIRVGKLSYKEPRSSIRKSRRSSKLGANTCDCPPQALKGLKTISISKLSQSLALQQSLPLDQFCYKHLLELCQINSVVLARHADPKAQHSQKHTIDPPAEATPGKRSRLDESSYLQAAVSSSHDDETFCQMVQTQLRQRVANSLDPKGSHGEWTDKQILQLLEKSHVPTESEAIFCSPEEAKDLIESGTLDIPIFSTNQQQFQWDQSSRPIEELLHRLDDDFDQEVSVQVSSRKATKPSAELKTFKDVQDRFLNELDTSSETWNLLDLRSPFPSFLPYFLTGENARLLNQVADTILADGSLQRINASREKWATWKNVLEWLILSDGSNTAPHRDADGFASWLSCQEGCFIFGWLSNPQKHELEEWMTNPENLPTGSWCVKVMRKGDTVAMREGTVHWVGRYPKRHTLTFGGHFILQTDIDHWSQALLDGLKFPNSTNEDASSTTVQLVQTISNIIESRQRRGRLGSVTEQALKDFRANITEAKKILNVS